MEKGTRRLPLGYDARGNLTSSGGASYSYGPENLLAATNGGLSFYYDGVGRLVEYTSSVSTRFFYDGNQMAAEVANPGGGILRRYVWGAGVDEALVWYEGSGTGDKRDDGRPVPRTGLGSMGCFPPSSLHADERGSVSRVLASPPHRCISPLELQRSFRPDHPRKNSHLNGCKRPRPATG